jgi:hypothetical protein
MKHTFLFSKTAIIILVTVCSIIPIIGHSEWMTLMPSEYGQSKILSISERDRTYFSIEKGKSLSVQIKGPTQIRILTRLEFESQPSKSVEYAVEYSIDNQASEKVMFNSRPISSVRDEHQPSRLIGYLRIHSIDMPQGTHLVSFKVVNDSQRIWMRVQEQKATFVENLSRVAIQPHQFTKAVDLEVKEKITTYYRIGEDNEVKIDVIGPTNLQILTRLEFDNTMRGEQKFRFQVLEGEKVVETYSFSTEISDVAHYIEPSGNLLSRAEKVSFDIPTGSHSYRIVLMDGNRTALIKFLIPIKDLGNKS